MTTSNHIPTGVSPTGSDYARALMEETVQGILSIREIARRAITEPDDVSYLLQSIELLGSQIGFFMESAIGALEGGMPRIIGGAEEWLLSDRTNDKRKAHEACETQRTAA